MPAVLAASRMRCSGDRGGDQPPDFVCGFSELMNAYASFIDSLCDMGPTCLVAGLAV